MYMRSSRMMRHSVTTVVRCACRSLLPICRSLLPASLSHNCGAACVCSVLKKAGAAQANLGKDADASLAALRDQVTRLLSIRVYRGPHRTCSAPS
jgi:hypothetical protein